MWLTNVMNHTYRRRMSFSYALLHYSVGQGQKLFTNLVCSLDLHIRVDFDFCGVSAMLEATIFSSFYSAGEGGRRDYYDDMTSRLDLSSCLVHVYHTRFRACVNRRVF